MTHKQPLGSNKTTSFKLPADVREMLPRVAEAEGETPHAFGVRAIATRTRRAARKHGIEPAATGKAA